LHLTDVVSDLETDKLKKEEEKGRGKLINEYIRRDYEYMNEHKKISTRERKRERTEN
jgi:hypothetical protein